MIASVGYIVANDEVIHSIPVVCCFCSHVWKAYLQICGQVKDSARSNLTLHYGLQNGPTRVSANQRKYLMLTTDNAYLHEVQTLFLCCLICLANKSWLLLET